LISVLNVSLVQIPGFIVQKQEQKPGISCFVLDTGLMLFYTGICSKEPWFLNSVQSRFPVSKYKSKSRNRESTALF